MPRYIIKWNAGYGDVFEEIELKDEEEALQYAYESWQGDVENDASYSVVGLATDKLRKDLL